MWFATAQTGDDQPSLDRRTLDAELTETVGLRRPGA